MINLPEEFTNKMKDQLRNDFDKFISSYDQPAYKALRINMQKVAPEDYDRVCSVAGNISTPVKWWPSAYYYDSDGPGRSPLFYAGAYYIQEPSAMLPVTLLDVDDSGQKVLDLCAAPGGKSTQIADLMNGYGLLVANEVVPSRASVLSENIERMGVTNALVISENPVRLAKRFPGYFDRILVDAPCSGEGMFRKNPEAVKEWSPDNVKMCAERQKMLLDCAASMLSPEGIIVYSTCTFSPEEDEEAVEYFLDKHRDFALYRDPLKVYPHTVRGEGHFVAAFSRGIEQSDVRKNTANASPKSDRPRFFDGTGLDPATLPANALHFGDSIYLPPDILPDINGLKVYRAGLKLGTHKKNRFEPDHALSHALTIGEAELSVDFKPDSPEIRQYLAGMTLNCDRDMKGWCLVCTMGLPLGWGKASGGVLKNHYPKGLRK